MFEQFEKDTVGCFSTWTIRISPDGEYHKFGFIDVRSVPADALPEDRELIMQACRNLVDQFCNDEMRHLGKVE